MTQDQAPSQSKKSIEDWLILWIAKDLGLPPGEIDTDESLLNYSLSSVTAMMLVGDLEEWLGLTLPPTLVWDYPSIAAIADYLREQLGSSSTGLPAGVGADPGLSLDSMSDQEVTALLNRLIADGHAEAQS
jgi:acyl carrier protein